MGLGQFLELGLRVLVADVAIGMVLPSQLAECALDIVGAGIASHAENLVVVALRRHKRSAFSSQR